MSNDKIRAAAEQALALLDRYAARDDIAHEVGIVDVPRALRQALAEQPQPEAQPVDDLVALVMRMARDLKRAGHPAMADKAMDFLRRKKLMPSPLRDAAPPPPAAAPSLTPAATVQGGSNSHQTPQPEPSGWIACDERMPDAGVEVLVWLAAPAFKGSINVAMDTWDEQHEAPVAWSSATIPVGMGWDSGTDWERITHWMPLPAAPEVAPPPSAPQPEAPSQFARGIDAAARFVEKRLADYDAEHGSTDPDTGTREYPGTGDEYACELAEIAEAIRALAPPPAAAPSEAEVEHEAWAKEFAEWEQHWRESARAEGLTDTIKAYREGEADAARFFADAMKRAALAARSGR